MKFCCVVRHKGKEVGRSKPLSFEEALAEARSINQSNQDSTWNANLNAAYVEEAVSVKHLPVDVSI